MISKNAFWKLNHSDPFKALSWDDLHSHGAGLFADHIRPEIEGHLERLGRNVQVQVNNQ